MSVYESDLAHSAAVADLAACVAARPQGKQLTIRKATRSHLPHLKSHKAAAHQVDVSGLTRILRVDVERRVVVAQGLVNMGQLVDAALKHGLVPEVVPELRAFTVSGLINGLGVQSSSHRYGVFPETCESFQVVLPDGRVVTASETSHPDLFTHLPGSYGTLGIVTAAEVRCVPAQPYVRSRYYGVGSAQEMQHALACASGRCDYVDGYMFSPSQGVVVVGDFAVAPSDGAPLWDVRPEREQYYFQRARDMGAASLAGAKGVPGAPLAAASDSAPRLSSRCSAEGVLTSASVDPSWLFSRRPCVSDTMPTADYIFRLERGFWWQVWYMTDLPALLEQPWGRSLVASAVNAELAALDAGAQATGASWSGQSGVNSAWRPSDLHACAVNQDCVLRLGRVSEGLDYVATKLGVWPLWLCPCVVRSTAPAMAGAGLRRVAEEEGGAPIMSCDMGVYGEPTVRGFRHRRDVAALQRFIDCPAFWGMSYLPPEELWQRYDRAAYDAVRSAYGADAVFPHIISKVSYHDEHAEDQPPILLWRLYRRGIRGRVLALLAVGAAAAVYAGAKGAGWSGLGLRQHARDAARSFTAWATQAAAALTSDR